MKLVIKLGGELLSPERRAELASISEDLRALLAQGHRVVLVHGGGPQTTALQKALGQEPQIIGGRRITDQATLDVLLMVVAGKLNADLTSALRAAGINAVGLNGVSGHLIQCVKRPPKPATGSGGQAVDFGFVGDITGLNHDLLNILIDHGYTPVLACVGSDASGQAYNINADMVANGVAQQLGADILLLLTNIAGVLRDVQDPSSRIARLTVSEGRAAIQSGVVSGGMIPKLEESFEVLDKGVGQIQILGALKEGDLLRAIQNPGVVGTALLRD